MILMFIIFVHLFIVLIFSFSFVCMWLVCAIWMFFNKYEHLWICVSKHVNGSCWCPWCFSILFIEARYLNQIHNSIMWLVLLGTLHWQPLSPSSEAIICHLIWLEFICICMHVRVFVTICVCTHVSVCISMCTHVQACAINPWHLLFYTDVCLDSDSVSD